MLLKFFLSVEYCRIDGGTAHEDRIAAIDEYNKPGSEKFILLTTRAGGLGTSILLLPMLSFCTTVIGMHLI